MSDSPPDPKRDIHISKSLSKLLRHQAEKEKLEMDCKGFVSTSDILKHNYLKSNKATLEDLTRVVANDSKSRYTLELRDNSQFYICANQGHSIKTITTDLTPLKEMRDFPTDVVVHGTNRKSYQLIQDSGYLSRMNRNHIHFAIGLPDETGVISGMRSSASVLFYLDIERLLQDGYPFWKSKNNVILSEGIDGRIPLEYFRVEIKDKK